MTLKVISGTINRFLYVSIFDVLMSCYFLPYSSFPVHSQSSNQKQFIMIICLPVCLWQTVFVLKLHADMWLWSGQVEGLFNYDDVQHLENKPNLAICSFDMHERILTILFKLHQHTFRNYMHILLYFSLHFYLLHLLLNSCDWNEAISSVVGFILADVQSDVFSPSCLHIITFHWSAASSMTFCDMPAHVQWGAGSNRWCRVISVAAISKQMKLVKVKRQGK